MDCHLSVMAKQKGDITETPGEMKGKDAKLETEVADSKENRTEHQNCVNELVEFIDEKGDTLPTVDTDKHALIINTAKMKGANDKLESEVQALRASAKKMKKELKTLLERLKEKNDTLLKTNLEKNQLTEKLSNAQGMNEQFECIVMGLEDSQTKSDNEYNDLQERFLESQRIISIFSTEKQQLQGMYDDMESLNKKLITKLEESKDDVSKVIAELHKRLHNAEDDLATVRSEKDSLSKMMEQVERDNLSLSAELNKVKACQLRDSKSWMEEKAKLKKYLKDSDYALVMLSTQKENLEKSKDVSEKVASAQLNESQSKLQTIEGNFLNVIRERDELIKKLQTSEVNFSSMKDERGELNKELLKLQQENQSLKEDLIGAKSANSNIEIQRAALEKSTAEAENRFGKERDNLNEIINQLQRDNQSCKQEMEALSVRLDDSKSLQSYDSYGWMEEENTQTNYLAESQKSLEILEDKKVALEIPRVESERKVPDSLEEIEKERDELMNERSVLQIATGQLKAGESEVDNIIEKVDQLQWENQKFRPEIELLAVELNVSKSHNCHTWTEEKCSLAKRIVESKKSLEMMEEQKVSLEVLKDEKEKIELMNVRSSFQKSLEIATGQVKAGEEEMDILVKKGDQLQWQNQTLKQEIKSLAIELNKSKSLQAHNSDTWMEEKNTLNKRLDEFQKSLKMAEDKNVALDMVKAELEQNFSDLLEETERAKNELMSERSSLQKSLETARDQLKAKERDRYDYNEKVDQLQWESQTFKQEIESLTMELNSSTSLQLRNSDAWMEEKNTLTKRLIESEKTLEMMEDKIAALESLKTESECKLSDQLEEAKREKDKLINERFGLQRTLEIASDESKAGKEERENLNKKIDQLQLENQACKEEIESLAVELNDSKSLQSHDSYAWMQEKNTLTQRLVESQKFLEMNEDQKAALEMSKAESEKRLSDQLEETKRENGELVNERSNLQKSLHISMDQLKNAEEESDNLHKKVDQMQLENQARKEEIKSLTAEINDLTSIQSRNSYAWMEEKTILTNRLVESQRSLEMIQAKKTDLEMLKAESEQKLAEQLEGIKKENDELLNERLFLQNGLRESKRLSEIITNEKAVLDEQKKEIETKLSVELIQTKNAHNESIEIIQACLDETKKALRSVMNDKNTLQHSLEDLQRINETSSIEFDDFKTLMSRKTEEWNEEKQRIVEDRIRLKKRLKETEKTLVLVSNQKTASENQRTELKSAELKLIEKNADLQARLQNIECNLSSIKAEVEQRQRAMDDLQKLNHDLSHMIDDSKRTVSLKETEWNEENQRMTEEKENLRGEIKFLKKNLRDSERTLVMVASEREKLVNQRAELTRLQVSFVKEKEKMMDRQHGLEEMLKEALGGKSKENKENTRKNIYSGRLSLDPMKLSRAQSLPGAPPSMSRQLLSSKASEHPSSLPRSIAMPRSRQSLSPLALIPPEHPPSVPRAPPIPRPRQPQSPTRAICANEYSYMPRAISVPMRPLSTTASSPSYCHYSYTDLTPRRRVAIDP